MTKLFHIIVLNRRIVQSWTERMFVTHLFTSKVLCKKAFELWLITDDSFYSLTSILIFVNYDFHCRLHILRVRLKTSWHKDQHFSKPIQ